MYAVTEWARGRVSHVESRQAIRRLAGKGTTQVADGASNPVIPIPPTTKNRWPFGRKACCPSCTFLLKVLLPSDPVDPQDLCYKDHDVMIFPLGRRKAASWR